MAEEAGSQDQDECRFDRQALHRPTWGECTAKSCVAGAERKHPAQAVQSTSLNTVGPEFQEQRAQALLCG